MKISIITAVKNGMPFLKDAIKSFELQKYRNKELIIVYSKSIDGTENYINTLSKKNYMHTIFYANLKQVAVLI
jgi:glycosyltransferase involved in cell wall biosynthesis